MSLERTELNNTNPFLTQVTVVSRARSPTGSQAPALCCPLPESGGFPRLRSLHVQRSRQVKTIPMAPVELESRTRDRSQIGRESARERDLHWDSGQRHASHPGTLARTGRGSGGWRKSQRQAATTDSGRTGAPRCGRNGQRNVRWQHEHHLPPRRRREKADVTSGRLAYADAATGQVTTGMALHLLRTYQQSRPRKGAPSIWRIHHGQRTRSS